MNDFFNAMNDQSRLDVKFWKRQFLEQPMINEDVKNNIKYWIGYLNRDPDNAIAELNKGFFEYRKEMLGI